MKSWLCVVTCLLWLVIAPGLAGAVTPAPGMLLIARETLPDPRFHQAVVLVVQHGSKGTAGLILNRPSRLGIAEVLPELPVLAAPAAVLSYGGPVAPRTIMALVQTPLAPPKPSQQVIDTVYLTGPQQLAAWLDQGQPPASYRVFLGYAGWAPEQLASEVARGDWQVLPADVQVLFSAELGGLWEALAKRRQ